MEERLNCRLFERGGRTVRMTDEALALQQRIERVLAELRDMEQSALRGRQAMEGRFRLGIIPTVAPYLLPRILPGIRARFPDLQLELREAVTPTLVEDTALRRIDAFVAAMPLPQPGLVTEELFADRFFLAVPAGDPAFAAPPVPPESPALERLMLLEEGHCLREQALAVCGSVKPVAMASYGATSLTTLLQMVSHGMGVTLVPELAPGRRRRDARPEDRAFRRAYAGADDLPGLETQSGASGRMPGTGGDHPPVAPAPVASARDAVIASISAESAALRCFSERTRQACERRITPSDNIFRWLARSVEPVVVMSTMTSAEPAAGAPSVAPRLSTMR